MWSEVIEPAVVDVQEDISEDAHTFMQYFESAYIGKIIRGR